MKSENEEEWLIKCKRCKHIYIPKNNDDEVRCRCRNGKCNYKEAQMEREIGMKIKVTEIEASGEDLRSCRSFAESFSAMISSVLEPYIWWSTNMSKRSRKANPNKRPLTPMDIKRWKRELEDVKCEMMADATRLVQAKIAGSAKRDAYLQKCR